MDTALNSYRKLPDPLYDHLVLHARTWLIAHDVFPGDVGPNAIEHAALAAGVFTYYCSPEDIDLHALELTAEFAAIFFYLDDIVEATRMNDDAWSEFHAALMRSCRRTAEPSICDRAVSQWLADFTTATGDRQDLQHALLSSFERYCQALDTERHSDHRPERIDVSSYWRIRRNTVFAEPYIACLQALLGLSLADEHRECSSLLLARAIDMICIINDLGSVERDKNGNDLNLILLLSRIDSTPIESAMQIARKGHDALAHEFRNIAAIRSVSQTLENYIDLLESVVDGHLRATCEYSLRFGSPHELLTTVQPLRPTASR